MLLFSRPLFNPFTPILTLFGGFHGWVSTILGGNDYVQTPLNCEINSVYWKIWYEILLPTCFNTCRGCHGGGAEGRPPPKFFKSRKIMGLFMKFWPFLTFSPAPYFFSPSVWDYPGDAPEYMSSEQKSLSLCHGWVSTILGGNGCVKTSLNCKIPSVYWKIWD